MKGQITQSICSSDHESAHFLVNNQLTSTMLNELLEECPKTSSLGRLSILVEYNKKSETGFIMGLPAPEILGGVLSDAHAKAIVASMDNRSGGVSVNEFVRLVTENGLFVTTWAYTNLFGMAYTTCLE